MTSAHHIGSNLAAGAGLLLAQVDQLGPVGGLASLLIAVALCVRAIAELVRAWKDADAPTTGKPER